MLKLQEDQSTKFKKVYTLNKIISFSKYMDNTNIFMKIYDKMFHNMQHYFRKASDITNRKLRGEGKRTDPSYPFIQMSLFNAIQQLNSVHEYLLITNIDQGKRNRFLDAGCGPGNIIMLAQSLSILRYPASYHGIELDKKGAELARILLGAPATARPWLALNYVWNTDIITFKHYAKYNVIYYYCPIRCIPLQILFEEILEDKVKIDTVIMPNLKQSRVFHTDKRFREIKIILRSPSGSSRGQNHFIQKISDSERNETQLHKKDIKSIPKKYHKLFKQHIDKIRS